MNTHNDICKALEDLVNESPEFKRLLETDQRVSDFVGLCVQQASIGDRVLNAIGETSAMREYVIQVIAEWVANTWRSEYAHDSSTIN